MKHFNAIFFRELRSYFDSPIAYIFLVVFLLINCGLYIVSLLYSGRAEMRAFFDLLPLVLVVFIPAITMRLWAEDRKLGTIELLLTLPIKTYQVVIGKFLASFIFFILALLGTLTIPIALYFLGNPDFGPIMGGYIGAAILGSFYLSIGIFVSGLCRDQIVAFIIGLVLCYLFYISGANYIAGQIDGWTGSIALGTKLQNYISLTSHFEGMERGVIDIKDIVYFLSMTVLFLLFNIQFLNMGMKHAVKGKFIATVIIFSGIAIFANVVASGFSSSRFDLTEEKIFTVSEASRNILRQIKTPVKVRFYVTSQERMPTRMKGIEQDVTDKLEELRVASDNRLTYEVVNPSISPELERRIQTKGIIPFQIQSFEKDEIAVKLIYSSLSISYLDKPEWVINAVHYQNLPNLEYELISKIYKLSLNKMPKIALYAPGEIINPQNPTMEKRPPGIVDNYTKLENLLKRERYNVVRINLDKESNIPEDADTLVIVRPIELNNRQRYEINRFLMRGGNLILAVQNYTYNYFSSGRSGIQVMPVDLFPNINPLIENYGVTVDNEIFMDNSLDVLSLPTKPEVRGISTSPRNIPVTLPIQIKTAPENMNKELSITNKISSLLYVWGSRLILNKDLLKEKGLKASVLVSSSKDSWTIPHRRILTKADMAPILDGFEEKQPLAVLIEGNFPDLFKEAYIPFWPDEESSEEDNRENIKLSPARMILIGNGEMFNNTFLEASSNAILMLNSVDSLTLGNDMINIRSRFQSERLIRKVSTEQRLWYRFFVILFVPILIVVVGILRFLIRRGKKKDYLDTLQSTVINYLD